MNDERCFDSITEGTTLKDALLVDSDVKTIVIDRSNSYGTSCGSLDKLRKSPYIQNISIKEHSPLNDHCLIIETLPFLLYKTSPIVAKWSERPYGGRIKYVDVDRVFFIRESGKIVWLPRNKTELIFDDGLSDLAKRHLFKAFSSGEISHLKSYKGNIRKSCNSEDDLKQRSSEADLKQRLSEADLKQKSSEEIISNLLEVFSSEDFKLLSTGFGSTFYRYPMYGMTEISENISIHNSLKGCAYILDENLSVSVSEDDEYKYNVETSYGIIKGKKFTAQNLEKRKSYVRVLNVEQGVIEGCCVGYILGEKKVQVIVLDSSARVCSEGTQLVYFISYDSVYTGKELELLVNSGLKVYYDITFETLYDPSQFRRV